MKRFLKFAIIILTLVSVVGFKSIAWANPQTIDFATYVGGTGEDMYNVGNSMAVDSVGNVYVAGQTRSADYPTTPGAAQTTFGGGLYDAVVTKFDSTGSIVYSTFLGGSKTDLALGIVVDDVGAVYVTGEADSPDFPVTTGALLRGDSDAFVAKISPDGSTIDYATFIGGGDIEYGVDITRDSVGNIYVTGTTYSYDFPRSPSAFQLSNNGYSSDAFIAKLDPTLSNILWASYLGGNGLDSPFGIEVDGTGIYVAGGTRTINFPTTAGAYQTSSVGPTVLDVFVTKIDHGGAVVYSTLIGGSATDRAFSGLKVDSAGAVYLAGVTSSMNFPTTAGAYEPATSPNQDEVFALKLSPDGSALEFSTLLGDMNRNEVVRGMDINDAGEMFIAGGTMGTNFPVTADAMVPTKTGFYYSSFLVHLDATGSSLLYSSYLEVGNNSSEADGVVVGPSGAIYVTGRSKVTDLVKPNGSVNRGDYDIYLTKFKGNAPVSAPVLGFDIVKAEIKLDRGPGFDRFEIEGFLKDPIDPTSVAVALGFDTWADAIPTGSFKAHSDNFKFKSDGIEFKIYTNGRFKIKGKRVDLGNIDLDNPVAFVLQIGEYSGSASLDLTKHHNKRSAKLERHKEEKREHEHEQKAE